MTDRTFSVHRGMLLGFITLGILCGGLFGWGTFASISGAVIASGWVKAEGGDRTVEHIDGGAVAAVLVRDGDRVAAGEVLVRIDGALLRSQAAILEAELFDLIARRNRLVAEFHDDEAIKLDPALADAAEANPEVHAVVEGHRRLFEARRTSRVGFVAQFRERIVQIRRQIAGLEAQGEALARQINLVNKELEVQRDLFDRSLTRLPELLELERGMVTLEGRQGEIVARIAEAHGRIAEIEIQILQIDNQRIEESETELRQVQAREHTVREHLAGLRVRLGQLEVRSPIAGVVHDLTVSTFGEVLKPGEPIAKVVPVESGFIVKVQLDPIHVDQVWPGQDGVLRFSAFSAQSTPEYGATVTQVSADAFIDIQSGLSWYEVELAIGEPIGPDTESGPGAWVAAAKALLDRLGDDDKMKEPVEDAAEPGEPLVLAPGMPVEVYIQTGERSPLSYLVKPITDYFKKSLREA